MKKSVICFLFSCTLVPTPSLGQDDFGLPTPIDIDAQRRLLAETFPEYDANLPRLSALQKFARELELYRLTEVEGFRGRIGENCGDANEARARIDSAWDRGELSPNEHENNLARVQSELDNCLLQNRENSEYWSIYDDFLSLYRETITQNSRDVDLCYQNDQCREGS